MLPLDGPTAALVFFIGASTLSLFILVLRSAAPHYKGFFRLALGEAVTALGFVLLEIPQDSSPWLKVVAANTLIILGVSLVGNGTWVFLQKPFWAEPLSYLPPLLVSPLLAYLTFLRPSMPARVFVVSLVLVFQFISSAVVLLHRSPFKRKGAARFTAASYVFLAVVLMLRIVLLLGPAERIPLLLSSSNVLMLMTMAVANVGWTFGIMLMSVTRLAEELAARDIKENREHYDLMVKAIIEAVPQSVILKNSESRYLLCNSAFAESLGKKPEDLVGTCDTDHFPEELAEKYRRDDNRVMDEGSTRTIIEEFVRAGQRFWIETIKTPVRDFAGRVGGVLVMFQDITERLAIQKTLEDSERSIKELNAELERRVETRTLELREAQRDIDLFFKVTIDFLCILDTQGRFQKLSPSWSKQLGWPEDELAGAQVLSFLHQDDRERAVQAMKFPLSGVPLRDFHLRFRRADGTWMWLSISAVGVPDRNLIIAAAHDVTVQMELDERLRTARIEAERASRAKSQFIATMSHELRTPLNAVLGYNTLLDPMVQDVRGRGYLKSINTAGRALLSIINDILDLTRAEAGRIELVPIPFDPRRLLEELVDIFRFGVEEKGLSFRCRATESLPLTLLLDQARLRQVLVNLVGNAIKFTDLGSVSVVLDAAPETPGCSGADPRSAWKATILIEVRDTGIGMTDEYRNRLFDSFSQQDSGISRKYGGTGLGLAIAKRLLDLMGGTIRCDAPPEGGTRFSIRIPQVSAAGCAAGEELFSAGPALNPDGPPIPPNGGSSNG